MLSRLHVFVLTGLITALLLAVTMPMTVRGAEKREGMTLAPTDRSYEVEPGQTIVDELTILNDGQLPYDFKVYAAPYSVTGVRYDPNFIDVSPTSDAFQWVQFDQVNWKAEVRETVKVPFTLRVNKDAAPGSHYGVIFAETQPDETDGSIIRKKRLGMVLYVNVKGDSKLAGDTKSIDIGWLQSKAPITAQVEYANTGNVHYMSRQALVVKSVFGDTIYEHRQDLAVLPDRPRVVSLEWTGASWIGLYKVHVESTAADKTTVKESFVLVAPIWFLALVIVGVGAGTVYAIRGNRAKRH